MKKKENGQETPPSLNDALETDVVIEQEKIDKKFYEEELDRLQVELVKLQ